MKMDSSLEAFQGLGDKIIGKRESRKFIEVSRVKLNWNSIKRLGRKYCLRSIYLRVKELDYCLCLDQGHMS